MSKLKDLLASKEQESLPEEPVASLTLGEDNEFQADQGSVPVQGESKPLEKNPTGLGVYRTYGIKRVRSAPGKYLYPNSSGLFYPTTEAEVAELEHHTRRTMAEKVG